MKKITNIFYNIFQIVGKIFYYIIVVGFYDPQLLRELELSEKEFQDIYISQKNTSSNRNIKNLYFDKNNNKVVQVNNNSNDKFIFLELPLLDNKSQFIKTIWIYEEECLKYIKYYLVSNDLI